MPGRYSIEGVEYDVLGVHSEIGAVGGTIIRILSTLQNSENSVRTWFIRVNCDQEEKSCRALSLVGENEIKICDAKNFHTHLLSDTPKSERRGTVYCAQVTKDRQYLVDLKDEINNIL